MAWIHPIRHCRRVSGHWGQRLATLAARPWTEDVSELLSWLLILLFLFLLRTRGERGSRAAHSLPRPPRLYQPELWHFNLFGVFEHELWMNPATCECGGGLRWSSSPALYNSSCSCQQLSVDLKRGWGEKKNNQGNLRSIKAKHPVSMPVFPRWQTPMIDWRVLKRISCVHSGSESFLITISQHRSSSAENAVMLPPGSGEQKPSICGKMFLCSRVQLQNIWRAASRWKSH